MKWTKDNKKFTPTSERQKAWAAFQEKDWPPYVAVNKDLLTRLAEKVLRYPMWWCFIAGWCAAIEQAAALHESIDPASDEERLRKVPGAGAMGAVIEYREEIRKLYK